ncbi:hypothetical protein TTHERM_00113320 (macronuclear) [Tetrahymena thermophila SB210]|uniref:Uncharacterized protein n=1 Tax=Tetrahymena thermophila (strain SB210) TaxID=312017 RepID=Q22Z39_TETTS|nr:hypothetical protein TTHERM_00113320 [Tetrahymena thermophila SB210]EAR90482.2 hypothetical protein TTHERM_00113320 [Tetrahymena thermophila SB210]|eukprot:XP_001010727.2 hypothetical protein TTHERM_00113320 [Tetrahymena thermophila SB210]
MKQQQQQQQHLYRESKSQKNQNYMSDYQDFENQDSSFEFDEKSYKQQPSQLKYPNQSECVNLENQKLRSVSVLENKNKFKRQKNKKLTFKIDLNKMKNPYKQTLKGKNKNKSIFDDPEFSGIANTDINLYALHKQGVIDEENNQWGKLQKQIDEINPKPDINIVLDSLVTQKFSRPIQEFKLQKHLALPEYNQSEVSSRYKQNSICEILDEDPEIDKYIEETKQQILQKKKQIDDNLKCQKSSNPILNQPHKEKSNDDCSISSDEQQENQFENGVKSRTSNKKNEYILSEEEHKELFLLYCAKGHSPESACQQARVPIKCAKRWICNLTPSRLTGGGRKIIDGMLEQKLRLWILLKLYKELKIPSRDQQIKYSLSQIKQNSFGCSKGWLEKYLDRNLLKFIVAHLRNLEVFRLEEVAKFFIVIPSVNQDLGQVQKEIKLVQSYQKRLELELETTQLQNNDREQSNYVPGTKVKREDLIIQPFIHNDQNYFFNKMLQSVKEKNNLIIEPKYASNKDMLNTTFNSSNPQQKPLLSQVPFIINKIPQDGFTQYQNKSTTNNKKLNIQVPDWSPYLQMIERANAMKQLQYYLTDNKNIKKLEIEDNQLLSIKAQMIERLKQNTQISQETLAKFGNLYKFQEVQKLQETQKQKLEKRQSSQMQIEQTQADQETHKKSDLKQTKTKLKKLNIENEEEEDEEEDFQTKCKNEFQTKFDEREFYVDTKKPLPLHIRKLLKLSAINSRSDRLSQQPKNLEYYLKGCVFEIEAQNFFDVAVKTLNYKIESLIQVFKFRF